MKPVTNAILLDESRVNEDKGEGDKASTRRNSDEQSQREEVERRLNIGVQDRHGLSSYGEGSSVRNETSRRQAMLYEAKQVQIPAMDVSDDKIYKNRQAAKT